MMITVMIKEEKIKKKSRTRETLTLSTCSDNGTVLKNKTKHISSIWNTAWFSSLYAGDPEQNAGTIHESNLEHLLVFKAPPGDNPRVQSGTTPCF